MRSEYSQNVECLDGGLTHLRVGRPGNRPHLYPFIARLTRLHAALRGCLVAKAKKFGCLVVCLTRCRESFSDIN